MRTNSTIGGNFQLLHETHNDSVYRVFRGRALSSQEEVEVHLLPRETAADPARVAAFLAITDKLKRVQHANVATVLAAGVDEVPYVVFHAHPGIALEKLLATKKLDVDSACEIALQVLAGLAAAQEHGVSHPLLLPRDVIVNLDSSPRLRVKVLRLGVLGALLGANASFSLSRYEQRFVAPEVLNGGLSDPRSDLFSVGMLLFEMLSRVGYRSGDPSWQNQGADLAALIRRNPTVPEPLVSSLACALSPDRNARMRSPADFARLLIPYVKPKLREESPEQFHSLDPALRETQESDVPPSVLLNRAPRPRSDSACPEAMLMDPTFPRSPGAPRLEALHADAYGKRRPPAHMELEVVEHSKPDSDSNDERAGAIGRTAAAAAGAGFGVGAAMAWLGKLL